MLRKIILFLFLMAVVKSLQAQLNVVQGSSMNMTPLQLVQNYIVGAGVTVSNATYNGSSASITSDQLGTFIASGQAATQLGISSGVLLTTGKANFAIGPNNVGDKGFNTQGGGDPDLNIIAGTSTHDKAIIEFDFVPEFDTIRFRYVFGSEEFFEYCNQYNDAFGFFLSGPLINGTFSNNSVNIALMPGSATNYVTINNICSNPSSHWNNSGGLYYQYDGLTHIFTAFHIVKPCSTYHIKLSIGDAVDHIYDSGVFLEKNSFSSPGVNLSTSNSIPPLGKKAVEGCSDVAMSFKLTTRMHNGYTVHYDILGTAVNGVDYATIPNYITFPPGHDTVSLIIHPYWDTINEGEKTVILKINQISCDGTIESDTAFIEDYVPLSIEPANDTTVCAGSPVQLSTDISGGYPPLAYQWNLPNAYDSTITVTPPVGQSTYTVKVTDVCMHYVADTITIMVHPVPTAHAGQNVTIQNGTSTTLHGSATGGYGNYTYSWTSNPPGFTSTEQHPSTGNLSHSTIFLLVVNDLQSNCQSEVSQVSVFVEGGALSTLPVAQPPVVCFNDTVHLYAMPGGGSGIYSYNWSSTPPGFSSHEKDPLVVPIVTTTYLVSINDGYNLVTGSTTVEVNPVPSINIGHADTAVCVFDFLRLDAGNPGCTYLWSNGATTREITVGTTGLGYDSQTYHVLVTNAYGCSDFDSITVIFSFDACLGINEKPAPLVFRLYPNPASHSVIIETEDQGVDYTFAIWSTLGKEIYTKKLESKSGKTIQQEIYLSELPRGIYLVRLSNIKSTGTQKLILY